MRLAPAVEFKLTWEALGGPALEEEHRFHPTRRWRFDYAHLPSKTAIEIEGGAWTRGRHTRPQGFINDCTKYNAAAHLGWVVFRLPADLVDDENIRPIIERCKLTVDKVEKS